MEFTNSAAVGTNFFFFKVAVQQLYFVGVLLTLVKSYNQNFFGL